MFVPAVKDVSEEAQLKRGTIISEIVDLILEDYIRTIKDVKELEEGYKKILKDLPILSKLNKDISELLQEFAPGTSAHVDWNLEEFELPLPQTEILVQEDGFATHINRVGHGTQRAMLFALLQYITEIKQTVPHESEGESIQLPTIFLAIEELELYQHPQRQKHLQKLFRKVTSSGFRNFKVQVIYSTHSPLLINVEIFDNLRLLRKESDPKNPELKHTAVYRYSRDEFEQELTNFDISSRQKQLKNLVKSINPLINEGFFADKVVFVEGWSDKAALEAVAEQLGLDFDRLNISVIPVGGKGNILAAYLIFRGFNIPTYGSGMGIKGKIQRIQIINSSNF